MSEKQSKDKEKWLNQRGCAFSIVLNDNELHLFKSANYVLNTLMCCGKDWIFVACVLHDKDFDVERKCYKTQHYHVVITFGGSYRVGTILNLICDEFHCNENQVSIEKCNSVPMQVRYLVHLDDFDKHQYDFADIHSNRMDIVDKYLHQVKKIVDEQDLFSIMKEYPVLQDLIGIIGLDQYKKWRVVIQDLRRERY